MKKVAKKKLTSFKKIRKKKSCKEWYELITKILWKKKMKKGEYGRYRQINMSKEDEQKLKEYGKKTIVMQKITLFFVIRV